MKFIHMADMHFDAQFVELASKGNLATQRRLEQRKAFKDIVEYIQTNSIPYFFIAGDLYEQEYIRKSTIEFVNNLFKTIPNTKVFIVPGNHDPYIKNSFYKQFKWSDNVHVFSNELEIVELEGIDIYGYGFDDFYMNSKYHKIEIKNPNKINILITHGSLDASDSAQKAYNPLNSNELKRMGFNYIALGHIHKNSYNDYSNQNIVYPGSTVSLGFDELGERGIIVGDIDKDSLDLNFVPIDTKSFSEKELDISNMISKEDLVEEISNMQLEDSKFYKIILTGKRNFDIDILELNKLISRENIIKIRNHTKIKYDIEEIANQISLKGLFAKKMLQKMEDVSDEEKDRLLDAFEEGMEVLCK